MALEDALERFPLEAQLRDGTKVMVRPIRRTDCASLHKFFCVVPEPERLFIERPVTNKGLFEKWCSQIDLERDFNLLMFDKRKVIGWINLHVPQGGWMRHIGHLTLLTHPHYRGRDVSLILGEEIITVAQHLGLWKLKAELNGERKIAIRSLQHLGFEELFCLPDYVIDMTRQPHDYMMLGLDIKTDEEYAGMF
ncbi:MAG: GNAT family N-acetyltransferase [Verrucomicrobia bacterium]|jgi:GNAT superfamily N-acetyltransferase|nr:GNAT family N-acetyltransferase [Verrucomicrobiota bacterium]